MHLLKADTLQKTVDEISLEKLENEETDSDSTNNSSFKDNQKQDSNGL